MKKMNLIIHITNNVISFFNEKKGKVEFLSNKESTQSLYFFYNKFTNELKNHARYKTFFLENKTNFFGNILSKLNEKSQVQIGEKSHNYDFFIKFILNKIQNSYEKIKIIFSTSLATNTRSQLEEIIKTQLENVIVLNSFAEYSIKNYLLKNQQLSSLDSIYVVDSFSDIISISKAKVSKNQITILSTKTLEEKTYISEQYALAKKLVEDIYRLYSEKEKNNLTNDIEYVYLKISDKYKKIINQPKDFVVVSTRLQDSDERYILKITPNEIKYIAENYAKDFTNIISKNIDDNSKILLVGDIFEDEILSKKLNSLDYNFVRQDILDVFSTIDKEIVEEDEYSTMFLASDTIEEESDFKQIASLDLNQLEIGTNVKLNNYIIKSML